MVICTDLTVGSSAGITVTNIAVDPNPVTLGNTVNVYVTCQNLDASSVTETVYIKSDGTQIASRDVTLAANTIETKDFPFTAGSTGLEVGIHNISAETSGDTKTISLTVNAALACNTPTLNMIIL